MSCFEKQKLNSVGNLEQASLKSETHYELNSFAHLFRTLLQEKHRMGKYQRQLCWTWCPYWMIPTLGKSLVPLKWKVWSFLYASATDKTRLLMLYIISKEGGIFEDDKRKLLEHSQLSREHREAINNLSLMGVQVTKDRRLPGDKSLRKRFARRRTNKDEDQPYELSRYSPALKKSMDVSDTDALHRTLTLFFL